MPGMARPFISFLSDFGSRDPSAAIVHGVIRGICPAADVIDVSHEVRKYRVRDGALLLWCALPYLPVGVHLAVIDPGVGTARRGIALRTGRGDLLVGPDNGLLLPAAEERLGGLVAAHELAAPAYRLPIVSSSFHGRDVFGPAAAHLAAGVALEALGPPVAPADLVRLHWPAAETSPGRLRAELLYVDTFGNVKLGALAGDLRAAFGPLAFGSELQLAWQGVGREPEVREARLPWVETFGHVAPGAPLLYEDSYGRLCLAVNQGSAADRLGLTEDLAVVLHRA
jgi:hypothetical protein